MADDAPSAASRVLHLPELLEHILFYVARSAMRVKGDHGEDAKKDPRGTQDGEGIAAEHEGHSDDDYDGDDDDEEEEGEYKPLNMRVDQADQQEPLQPFKSLLALKRVSRMFCDSITTSKKLQRLMKSSLNAEARGVDPTAVVWLLRDMLQLEVDDIHLVDDECIIFVEEIETSDESLRQSMMELKKKHEKASWRGVLLCQDTITTVTLDVGTVMFGEGEFESYGESLSMHYPVTLGELFQCYCRIMERSKRQHRAIANK